MAAEDGDFSIKLEDQATDHRGRLREPDPLTTFDAALMGVSRGSGGARQPIIGPAERTSRETGGARGKKIINGVAPTCLQRRREIGEPFLEIKRHRGQHLGRKGYLPSPPERSPSRHFRHDPQPRRLDLPEGPHLATAVLAHCFTCGKDIPAARRISARLAAMGIATLRFDFTGLGHSGGEFANTSFTSNVDDLLAAADALTARGMAPALLIGHSLGGAAVLRAAGRIESVRAVATIGAPFDPEHVTHNFDDALEAISSDGKAEVMLGGRPVTIGRGFVEDVRAEKLAPALATLKKALLVLHAPRDEIVGIDKATRIFTAARHPKSFVTLDEADHLLTRAEDADYAAEVIAAWAGRYLDLRPPAPPPGVPEGVTRVSEADPEGFLQDVQAGARHHILADEPLSYGGTNRGLTPYQLLAAGLGACTSMTIRMYARRKGLPLSHVAVDVTHDRVQCTRMPPRRANRSTGCTRLIRLKGRLWQGAAGQYLTGRLANKMPDSQRSLGARAPTYRSRKLRPAEEASGRL